MSYYNSTCRILAKPFKPFSRYEKSDVPMEGCTTYRLSYWPTEAPVKVGVDSTQILIHHRNFSKKIKKKKENVQLKKNQ